MKSKAHFKSHPLHPILISFPIAFFIGTLISHAGGLYLDNEEWLTTATWLNAAGIIGAVLAAVPGFIDYLYTVPPRSSAKKRASLHGLLNTSMLVLFVLLFYYRRQAMPSQLFLLTGELIGVVIMTIAGWMGGTLVHRNQIGIDMRYANAGKWQEAYFSPDSSTLEVADTSDLKVNAMMLLHINGKRIVLARTEEGYAAFDDHCTHRGGSLAGGSLICETVQCPWHGSQFSVKTGEVTAGPANMGITTYPVTEKNGKLWLKL
ncbi:DUF2231 domain-containing protein [Flavisolibacter tropicus]|uniref:Rieske domain-containing protein n=1 Tax=Flavisolibacter tropicus TaxID=1492898 RepID=A0A172TX99_9BACT|nr:DUF2231 domain-containing protein [Flavisolibacter tropicus]ANE51731.1 hypothetical protein SY85_15730 [Flavisolibacter tropicus]